MVPGEPSLATERLEILFHDVLVRCEYPGPAFPEIDLKNRQTRRVTGTMPNDKPFCELEPISMEWHPVQIVLKVAR